MSAFNIPVTDISGSKPVGAVSTLDQAEIMANVLQQRLEEYIKDPFSILFDVSLPPTLAKYIVNFSEGSVAAAQIYEIIVVVCPPSGGQKHVCMIVVDNGHFSDYFQSREELDYQQISSRFLDKWIGFRPEALQLFGEMHVHFIKGTSLLAQGDSHIMQHLLEMHPRRKVLFKSSSHVVKRLDNGRLVDVVSSYFQQRFGSLAKV